MRTKAVMAMTCSATAFIGGSFACNVDAERTRVEEDRLYGMGQLAQPWPGGNVPVCFQNGNADIQARTRWILADTWAANANITFSGFGACNPAIQNKVTVVYQPSTNGSAGPIGYGPVGLTLISDSPAPFYTQFRYEVIHEFGHALGFIHEQERPDNFNPDGSWVNCGSFDRDVRAQFGGNYYTVLYDNNSVMNYCAGWVQFLSGGDISGVRQPYGQPVRRSKKRDIVLRNTGTGDVDVWLMDGATRLTEALPGVNESAWQVSGTGDFDNDGIGDILWRNTSNGATAIWFMSGGALRQQAFPTAVDGTWQIAGTGDFNADAMSDILWRNTATGATAIWFMNGGSIAAQAYPGAVDQSWQISGTGDFDGDGKTDILWRNTNGQNAIWFMDGGAIRTQAWPMPVDSSWQIKAVGDFNGDGKSDIFWLNTNGATAVWLMNGGSIAATTYPLAVDSTWQVQGVGDFDGDGKSDVLWRNTSGAIAIWFMNQSGMIREHGYPPNPAGNNWVIQGTLLDNL